MTPVPTLLTWERVTSLSPCAEAVEWGRQEFTGQSAPVRRVFQRLLYTNHWPWANWLLVQLLNRQNRIQYAVYATKQVLSIYERRHPSDQRPRQAIQAAERCMCEETLANRRAAARAADAAAYAADDAYDTADATLCAVAIAASDAAYAAFAAAAAADAAAAVGKKELRRKILAYGLRLLRRQR
jgi:hypothetical protein